MSETTTSSIDNDNNSKTPSSTIVTMVTLTSQDGTKFELSLAAALQSKIVRTSLDMDDDDNDHDKQKKAAAAAAKRNGQVEDNHVVVDLPRVSTDTLAKVVEFLKHGEMEKMQPIPFPLKGDSLQDCIEQEWYRNYIMAVGVRVNNKKDKEEKTEDSSSTKKAEQLEQQQQSKNHEYDDDDDNNENTVRNELFTLLDAANFMDIQALIDLIVLRVTFQVIGKNAQQLSDYFNLPMPTKEDEDFAREHYPWILEQE